MITNSEIKRTSGQVFAQGKQYESPFYNREISKKELKEKSKGFENGEVFMISELLGTGKTFFMDAYGKELGLMTKQTPLFVRDLTSKVLESNKTDPIIFVDEADIKTEWEKLETGLGLLADHIRNTGQKAILIGDYSLKNPALTDCFEKQDMMKTFEPLDQKFFKGVLNSRLTKYLKKRDSIVTQELMDLIIPKGMRPAASFRALLTMFSGMVRLLPADSNACRLTVDIAKQWADVDYPNLTITRQYDFLNLLLDFLSEKHPNGEGLSNGMDSLQLFGLASEIKPKFECMEDFESEILFPFAKEDLLISIGIPHLNDKKDFIRRPEPFLPSIKLLLLSLD